MSETKKQPVVIIVGAGFGGLMMGLLLERMGVPYTILERAAKVKPLGSAMSLKTNILTVLDQLGLLEEIVKFAAPVSGVDMLNAKLGKIGRIGWNERREVAGYEDYVFTRPKFYDLMLKQVPAHKVLMNKNVVRFEDTKENVSVFCADGTTYQGDILIGVDGIHSGVRQNLYKQLEEQSLLPKSDAESLTIGYTCMLGVAEPKDPSKYPQLKDPFTHFATVLGGGLQSWIVITVPGNQICWVLLKQFETAQQSNEQALLNAEWGPESNEAMIKEYRDFACPLGGVLGDLIDDTPNELISKVFLEEKLFETWHHGRTALIGDGAINAMQDAVIMSNCLYDMVDTTPESISTVFKEYYKQRYPRAKAMVEHSKDISKVLGGQTMVQRVARYAQFNYTPYSVLQRKFEKTAEYRPQFNWIPMIEARGTGVVLPQLPSRRYAEEQAKRIVSKL
ncbi:hypothetical protein BGX27_007366 [Mortierella sp. AM989]|nr:hypothetical protein BGX27_007366 [Mortierella sp. AM989]